MSGGVGTGDDGLGQAAGDCRGQAHPKAQQEWHERRQQAAGVGLDPNACCHGLNVL
jgi:hypothetical protein